MSDIKTKRERHPNYSDEETRLLVELVLQHKSIIESKISDAVTWKEKNEAWDRVAASFNARSSALVQRDSTNLKAKYESIKKNLKKKVAKEKCDIYITGGGPKIIVEYKDWEEKLLGILKLAICGLTSAYDCDGMPEVSPAVVVLPVSSPKPSTSNESIDGSRALLAEDNETCANEVSIAGSSNFQDADETALAITSPTKKWDSWTPASLRARKSLVLRKQPRRDIVNKGVLNEKYDALADERQKLIGLQMELAKKELEALRTRAAQEEEMHLLKKEEIKKKMEHDEEIHKLNMELLKQQLKQNNSNV